MQKSDEFFKTLGDFKEKTIKKQEMIIVSGQNCWVGKEDKEVVIGKYEEETRNGNGKRLIQLCKEHNYIVVKFFFHKKDYISTMESTKEDS